MLAHPFPDHTHLTVSPVLATASAVAPVLAVALAWPRLRDWPSRREDPGTQLHSWWGGLSIWKAAARILSVALLVLAATAGRIGSAEQLRNIAPALVVGVAWPLLVLGSATLGPVWRWLDPWDAVARVAERTASTPTRSVWPAALTAMGWTWYLTAYEDGLEPRAIGAALATYSIITIAGCLVVGRARWLSSAEVFGLLFAWTARVPRRLIRSWQPPPGTGVVLGVLAGGLLFGLVRGSPLWAEPSISNRAGLYATLGVLGFAATGATMMRAGEWWAGRIDAAAVAASSIPLVAGLALALSLARNRLFTSLQLLPILASDPFGRDWDLFGTADWMLDPNPLGDGGRTMVQILVLTGAGLASAVVVATGAGRRGRLAATAIIALVVAASVAAVTTS